MTYVWLPLLAALVVAVVGFGLARSVRNEVPRRDRYGDDGLTDSERHAMAEDYMANEGATPSAERFARARRQR